MYSVCHVTSAHPAEDGRIFRRACISAATSGYNTILVAKGNSYVKNNVHIEGIGLPQKPGRLFRMTKFAKKAFKKAVEINADLYQLHDPELLPYALKLKRLGKVVIFDSHENYPQQILNKAYLPKILSKLLSNWYEWYSGRVFSRIDGIVYPANDDYYLQLRKHNPNIAIVNNVPWLSELYTLYDENQKREPNSACYTGGIDETRGVTQMIKACYGAHCKLYLAGPYYSNHYMEELKAMNEFSCVEYLGVLDRKGIEALYKKVEIGLSLLLDSGQYYKETNLPTKVYEYMSMGLPIIVNDSSYNIQVVNNLEIGLCVNPMNVAETASTIRRLLDDSNLRNKYGANGRKAIFDKYNWDLEQKHLLSLYESLLEKE